MIRLEHWYFSYGEQVVFDDLNATILAGLNLVTGNEGSGKTTLLRLLAKQLLPQGGALLCTNDYSVYWVDPKSDAFDQISAVDYFQSMAKNHPDFDQVMASDIAVELGLEPHQRKPMYMLSTGSKRKVWIAAGFATNSQLTLFDEPFAALDGPSTRVVADLLLEASRDESRAWLIADYQAPSSATGIRLASVIDLDKKHSKL